MMANGKRSNRVVSLLDIYPTLLDLCGLPPVEKLEGQSLVPLLKNPKRKWDKPVLNSWYYGNRAVRSERYRYIQYRDGSEEFYDHASDPGEFTNLAENPEYVDIIAKHRAWLPQEDALPAGMTEWMPDRLDRRVANWLENDSIPDWLK
jgi:iduronate 2-sulfatase